MGRFTDDAEQFEDSIEVAEVLETLRALLPGGLEVLPPGVIRACKRDDYSTALAEARERYSDRGPGDRAAVITYVALLQGRGLLREAGGVLRRASEYHEFDVPLQLLRVDNLIAQGSYGAARDLLEGLRAVKPAEGRWWAYMGDIYLELGDDLDAIECYREALDRKLQEPDVAYRLARLLFERDRLIEACHFFERAARIATQDARLWDLAAEAWSEAGEYERAADAWARVVKLDEDEPAGWISYGVALRRVGRLLEAQQAFERAMALDPLDLEPRLKLAHTQFDAGLFEEALTQYRKLLDEDEDNVEALHGAAASAFEQGDIRLAEELARRVLALSPERAESHYNLGMVLAELHRGEEAVAAFREAVERSDAPMYRVALAEALLSVDELDEALELAEQSAREEAAPEALVEFAEALVRRGMRDQARAFMAAHADERVAIWALLGPLLEYVTWAASDEDPGARERLEVLTQRFELACDEHAEALPLDWSFLDLERILVTLPRPYHRHVSKMIRKLERG